MNEQMSIELTECTGILSHKKRVILGNTNSGEWIKISQECYQLIQTVIQKHYMVRDFINALKDESDKIYMKQLLNRLIEIGVITQNKQKQKELPKYITFAITERCNLNCKHCSVKAGNVPDKLNLEDCKKIIEKIITLSPEQIIFTGGEPLFKKGFIELLEYTRKRFKGHIGIMTNGTLFTKENISIIVMLVDSIDISIDGIDEETCAKIRGKGVFSKVMNSVKMLHKEGFRKISLSMVVTRQNQPHIQQFFELNNQLGTKPMLRTFSPIGRGEANRTELEIDRNNINKETINGKQPTRTSTSDIKVCSCGALKRTMYIDYFGNMFPCPILFDKKYSLGNILEQKELSHFFTDGEVKKTKAYDNFLQLYPQNYPECKDCDVNLFCWSCLHHIDMLQRGIISKNIRCEERKKQLQDLIWEEE